MQPRLGQRLEFANSGAGNSHQQQSCQLLAGKDHVLEERVDRRCHVPSDQGLIYLPNSDLHLNSNGDIFADAPWTLIVVNALELNSDSTLRINTDYESSSVPLPAGFDRGAAGDEYVRLSR